MALPSLTESDIRSAIPSIESIGEPRSGGQRVVFPCMISGKKYALKVMLAKRPIQENALDDYTDEILNEVTARARREVAILHDCDSPYLVKPGLLPLTSETIGDQSVIYFTEEWVDGESLKDIISREGRLSLDQVVKLGKNIAEAISEIWSLRKIHRDIKPGNVMLRKATEDYVLLDLGFAFDLEDESLTSFGQVPGTMIYFSPEQADFTRKHQLDFRSDLFSLGIVLYEAAVGFHPFYSRGMSKRDALTRILTSRAEPPETHHADIPLQLSTVIMRLLANQPHMRYRSIDSFISAIDSISQDEEGR